MNQHVQIANTFCKNPPRLCGGRAVLPSRSGDRDNSEAEGTFVTVGPRVLSLQPLYLSFLHPPRCFYSTQEELCCGFSTVRASTLWWPFRRVLQRSSELRAPRSDPSWTGLERFWHFNHQFMVIGALNVGVEQMTGVPALFKSRFISNLVLLAIGDWLLCKK